MMRKMFAAISKKLNLKEKNIILNYKNGIIEACDTMSKFRYGVSTSTSTFSK